MRKFILPILLLSLTASFSLAQTYVLKNDVIDDGGTKMSSSSYILQGSFGQFTIGKIASASYVAYIGFWHPYPAGPGVEEDLLIGRSIPLVFSLSQNYPNPFTRSTTIKYGLPKEGKVDIRVFNSAGQQIQTLVQENQLPGYYMVDWDLRGVTGNRLPSGVYLYRIKAGKFVRTKKMVILR